VRASLSVTPCQSSAVRRLQAALGLHRPTAEVLVRRGFDDPADARAFLEQEGALHDPLLLGAMPRACELLEAAIAAGQRIVVHGDYDVDGICATALAVETLRELGGDVGFHLPSRFAEGYGLAVETVDALADAGVGLLLTVDCGITAVDAVARARERGLEVIVSDHHRPGEVLPDAPLVASRGPEGERYPFAELCGTGVAFKIAQALWARRHGIPSTEIAPELSRQLDLVALATVADVVELRDENRALVRAGMRRLARGERPGLRALMLSASVDRARLRSSDLGFRLAPRINAAGRLGHPGVALELLLTRDGREADEHAATLEELNRERQGIEDSILRAAVETIEEWPADRRAARAYVVWGPDWHEGVIGIVASRLVERYGRPTVVLAVDGDTAKGSGRSVSAFDLHAGLHACQGHLQRWGGHRAAAGLSLESARIEAFARDFRTHADECLTTADLRRAHPVDAVLGVGELSIELARELARLEPFGLGNPALNLLLPASRLAAVETMGETGKHLRLQVVAGGARCGAVAFGRGSEAESLRAAGRFDVLCRLELNEWNGTVAPRLFLRDALPAPATVEEACCAGCAGELEADGGELVALPAPATGPGPRRHDARLTGATATIARLAGTGEATLVVAADVGRRRSAFSGPLDPRRFGAPAPLVFSARCSPAALAERLEALQPGAFALCDHWALARLEPLRTRFAHVVVLDPPAHPDEQAVLDRLPAEVELHVAWGPRELDFARSIVEAGALRPLLVALWRAATPGVPVPLAGLVRTAGLEAPLPPAEVLRRAAAVLVEAGLAERAVDGLVLGSPAGKVDLSASPTYARAEARRAERMAFLDRLAAEQRRPAPAAQASPARG
jgi:single-stranded-DNA-specific exonuclease